ncbi:cyclic AMP-dependent transcription factor ATF-7 isoform X1 [Hydra vulgaris]|uniref:cyclic AMP-dependent transcription factor ATF-7 isoform X1 n=1 Tax=Hydra vulgaris TaxID=6087 RepID=UPI001F5FCEF3|nr:cyclic AMP-dependent transcription factor ATF-7 isoform X1 [Hydra vulgaris]
MEKPFKCTKCSQCFANSDHLAVHKCQLHVKIPSVLFQPGSDQTPTPTRFMRTADAVDSQLFEEINPFDQDFSIASKNQLSSEANNEDISSTTLKQHKGPLQTPNPIITSHNFTSVSSLTAFPSSKKPSVLIKNEEECVTADKKSSSKSILTNENIKNQENQSFLVHQEYQDLCLPKQLDRSEFSEQRDSHSLSVFSLLQQQINIQCSPSSITEQSNTSAQLNQHTSSTEVLRDHLNKLIKSGQIKIQFSSSPSSTKVQATIVGTIATKQSGTQSAVIQSSVNPIILSSLASTVATPSIRNIAPSTNPFDSSVGSGVAKQKLRQVVQQSTFSSMDNNNSNNVISQRISISPSNQGKYKDIILEDEDSMKEGSESGGGKRRGRTSEELTPDEKRKKFLERNRAAASRCRQKRKVWVNQLEKKSDDLMQTNAELMNEINSLRSEVAQLKALLLAHKECPVTLHQKSVLERISSGGKKLAYVTVSDGQIIAIHPINELNGENEITSAEELASSALTNMGSISSNQP